MISKKVELEKFLRTKLGERKQQVEVIDYGDNNEEINEKIKYAHIVINIIDDWDYRQLCEVSFLDGKVSYVSGTISGSTMWLLQEWVEKGDK